MAGQHGSGKRKVSGDPYRLLMHRSGPDRSCHGGYMRKLRAIISIHTTPAGNEMQERQLRQRGLFVSRAKWK
jgi:hypothetical protein